MTQFMSTMQEGLAAIRASGSSAPVSPAAPSASRITDEEFDEASAAGNGKVIRAYLAQSAADLKREHIDPLQSTGLDAIAGLTRRTVLEPLPYYKKYQKEIDGFIAQMPAASRLQPEVLQIAHDAIVGRHITEIETEFRESATRARTAEPAESTPAARRGARVPTGDHLPSVEEYAGAEGVQALAELGRTGRDENEFARSLGYKDWKTYMKETREYAV
jgi:hypothetical protein